MPSVLLVQHDQKLRRATAGNLSAYGYSVTSCQDARSAIAAFSGPGNEFDICVIDMLLPGPDGIALTKMIREFDTLVPIIMLAACPSQDTLVEIFKSGANTYLQKPLNFKLLAHCLRPWLKRTKKLSADTSMVIPIGSWQLNCAEMVLLSDQFGTAVKLTEMMVALLRMLAEHQGKLLSREELLESVWGEVDPFLGRSMDVFISKIRRFFRNDPQIAIVNQRGKGFLLEVRA